MGADLQQQQLVFVLFMLGRARPWGSLRAEGHTLRVVEVNHGFRPQCAAVQVQLYMLCSSSKQMIATVLTCLICPLMFTWGSVESPNLEV